MKSTEAQPEKPRPGLVVAMVFLLIFIFFSPLLISRKWDWWGAWAYGIAGLLTFIVSRAIAARKNPDIITERINSFVRKDTKSFDKILAPMIGIVNILTGVVAGIEAMNQAASTFSTLVKITSLMIMVTGYAVGSWALVENRFFSGVVRIQKDRGQYVITTGPYAIVRHPGYSGALISCLATPVLLDSLWAFIPAVITCIILTIRTGMEDSTLQHELEGYIEYTRKTRFRLIPGIW